MTRGLRVAALVLAGALLVTFPGAGQAEQADCGVVLDQNDALSERDAGEGPATAVELPYEDEYPASISYPKGPVLDRADWFHISWDSDAEHRVMVNVSTRALGLSYLTEHRLPAPHLELAAYEPGADEPAHTADVSEDGVLRLDFVTEQTAWDVRVSVPGAPPVEDCPSPHSHSATSQSQSYNLYWGCHPHCVVVSSR